MYSNGGWGTGDSHKQVPDARKPRHAQDTKRMRLAEVPNNMEGETVETISRVYERLSVGG